MMMMMILTIKASILKIVHIVGFDKVNWESPRRTAIIFGQVALERDVVELNWPTHETDLCVFMWRKRSKNAYD